MRTSKKKKKFEKTAGCVFAIAFFLIIIIEWVIIHNYKGVELNQKNLIISAAHLEKIDGYTKIYTDKDRDVSYYVKDKKDLSVLPVGMKVQAEYLKECTVTNSGPGWFIFSVNNPENITSGMSGNRVKDSSGEDIGFISELVNNKEVKCYTLE